MIDLHRILVEVPSNAAHSHRVEHAIFARLAGSGKLAPAPVIPALSRSMRWWIVITVLAISIVIVFSRLC